MKKFITFFLLICFITASNGTAFGSAKWDAEDSQDLFISLLLYISTNYLFFKVLTVRPPVNQAKESAIDEIMYICTKDEMKFLKSLADEEDIEIFLDNFWKSRPPEFKRQHLERVKFAEYRFYYGKSGVRTDRGRVYILEGPPDAIEYEDGWELTFSPEMAPIDNIEIWIYFKHGDLTPPKVFSGVNLGGLFYVFGDYGDGRPKQVYSSKLGEVIDPHLTY